MEVSGEIHSLAVAPRGNNSGARFMGGWDGAQRRCGRFREEGNFLPSPGFEPGLSSP